MLNSTRSPSLSSMHGKDFVELVWENGPILVQGSGSSSNNRTEHEDAAAASRVYSLLNHDHHHHQFSPPSHQINHQHSSSSSSCLRIDDFQFSQGKNHSNLQQEPASSRSLARDSKVTTWGSPLKKKPRLGCDQRTGYKVNFPNFVIPTLFSKSANQLPPKNNNHSSLARVEEVEEIVAAAAATSSKSNDHCSKIESANKRLKGFQDQTSMTPNKSNPASQHVEAVRSQGCHGQEHNQTSRSEGAEPAAPKAKGTVANNNIELCNEPLLPSSVCSLGASNNPNICIRLHEDTTTDDSTNSSDNDDETEDNAVKETPAREGTRVKRSRNPEIHNLSEKKRREKINKKIRTLRELIPNCNKTDKASMLDDVIDYLKTLKLQLQIMTMGGGLCMPFMMLPHLQLPHQLMGGAGGMCFRPGTAGMPCSPPQFPIPPLSAVTDSSTLNNMFGNFSSQMRHPIPPIPHAPFIPMTGNLPTPPLMPTNTAATNMVENLANFVQLTNLEASRDSSGQEGKARTM